jgi:hypothetical protein
MEQDSKLDEFNRIEALRLIWTTLSKLALKTESISSTNYFRLFGIGSYGEDSFCHQAFQDCNDAGLIPNSVHNPDYGPFKHIVLKVFYSALNMGLVLPSNLGQSFAWDLDSFPFHFTTEGRDYFSEGFISVDDPGYLGESFKILQQRIPAINDGQIELLLEAQRCLKSGCYRAAIVVIGVANEDLCIELLDSIPIHCQKPSTGNQLEQDWKICINNLNTFSARWKSGVAILESIKGKFRKAGRGQSWGQWWELVPRSLFTLGEAVRMARNAAAHDKDRSFSRAEVALLLSAMPTHLEMISNLTEFLKQPPSNLIPLHV